ncbi:hypothetical protein FACS189493_1980 [Spirochaetia bacterium]|nr:hypothetical protein FACS189493_1980 [Spirochaetia bacterium]
MMSFHSRHTPKEEARQEIALKLKVTGMTVEQIVEVTGLPEEKIRAL